MKTLLVAFGVKNVVEVDERKRKKIEAKRSEADPECSG